MCVASKICGPGPEAEKVASVSPDRIRLNRDPHIKYKDLLGPAFDCVDRASAYFRKVAEVRAMSPEREFHL